LKRITGFPLDAKPLLPEGRARVPSGRRLAGFNPHKNP
jgi:hypothetical protein